MLHFISNNLTTTDETFTDSMTLDSQDVMADRTSGMLSLRTTEDVQLETLESFMTDKTGASIVTEETFASIVTEKTLASIVTEEIIMPKVTASITEQAITVSLLFAFWFYVNLTNGFLLCVMKKVKTLDTPQYILLACYMICDVLYCNFQLLVMVPVAIKNSMDAIHVVACRVFIIASASFFYSCLQLVGLIAYERYCYFITPLKYPMKFTKIRIYAIVTIIYSVSFCIALAVDLMSPRVPVATTMSCQATGPSAKIANIFYFIVFAIPSGLVTVVTLIKLRLTMSKHQAQVGVLPQAISDDQSAITGLIVKPIKKTLRMISLVSGSFWLTTMPGSAIRLILSASGITWLDTDYRTSIALFALSRASYLMITLISSILNPIIYLTVLPDIKNAAWKCLMRKQTVDIAVIHTRNV